MASHKFMIMSACLLAYLHGMDFHFSQAKQSNCWSFIGFIRQSNAASCIGLDVIAVADRKTRAFNSLSKLQLVLTIDPWNCMGFDSLAQYVRSHSLTLCASKVIKLRQ